MNLEGMSQLYAREMPVGKVKFQDIGEYGTLTHGVVSWYIGE